jgi:hypothetical protein
MTYYVARRVRQLIRRRLAFHGNEEVEVPGQPGTKVKFRQVYEDAMHYLGAAYEGLKRREFKKHYAQVPDTAYEPGDTPFFLTYDRCTSHSWWINSTKKVHVERPAISMLQNVQTPPSGHDIHQVPEHAIGTTKAHARRSLAQKRRQGSDMSTGELYEAVCTGSKRFGSLAVDRNLHRMVDCHRIVAADTSERVTVMRGKKVVTVKGTHGGYCYAEMS